MINTTCESRALNYGQRQVEVFGTFSGTAYSFYNTLHIFIVDATVLNFSINLFALGSRIDVYLVGTHLKVRRFLVSGFAQLCINSLWQKM